MRMSSPHIATRRFPVKTAVAGLAVGGVIWGLTNVYHVASVDVAITDDKVETKYLKSSKSWKMMRTTTTLPKWDSGH